MFQKLQLGLPFSSVVIREKSKKVKFSYIMTVTPCLLGVLGPLDPGGLAK